MREQILNELGALLQDNLGQRLTPALATGIATLFNQAVAQIEAEENVMEREGGTDSPTTEVRGSVGVVSKRDGEP